MTPAPIVSAGGTVAGAAAAAAPRVVEATTGLNALVNAGARNITFLAGDVGRLPEAVGQPSGPAGSAFSTAFNQGMQATLATYANQGVIVNYLDVNKIGDRVIANPAAFGLASAGASTAADVAAGNADRFLFYADNVHLSSAGFAIVGRYAVRQLEAPLHLAGPGRCRPAHRQCVRLDHGRPSRSGRRALRRRRRRAFASIWSATPPGSIATRPCAASAMKWTCSG